MIWSVGGYQRSDAFGIAKPQQPLDSQPRKHLNVLLSARTTENMSSASRPTYLTAKMNRHVHSAMRGPAGLAQQRSIQSPASLQMTCYDDASSISWAIFPGWKILPMAWSINGKLSRHQGTWYQVGCGCITHLLIIVCRS